jgi:hypothetical protein
MDENGLFTLTGLPARLQVLATIIALVLTMLTCLCYLTVFINPYMPLNPFPPPREVPLASVSPTIMVLRPTFQPTARPTFTPTPTFTPWLGTATPMPPTRTPFPSYRFHVHDDIMTVPNCETVQLRGVVCDQTGMPLNGITIRLAFVGNVVYKVTGEGERDGEFGFAPLSPDYFHVPVLFGIDVVLNEFDPRPVSPQLILSFVDCEAAGEFTNIVFQEQ